MNEKMNWTALRHEVSKKSGMSEKEVNSFLNALVQQIKAGLSAEGTVRINGLGTFSRKAMAARKSVNVSTGEPIVIPGYNKVSFTPSLAKPKVEENDPIGKISEQADEIMGLIAGFETPAEEKTPEVVEENAPEVTETPEVVEEKTPEVVEVVTETPKKKKKKSKGISRPWLAASVTVLCFALTLAGLYLYIGYRFSLWVDELSDKTRPEQVEKVEKIEQAPEVKEVKKEVKEVKKEVKKAEQPKEVKKAEKPKEVKKAEKPQVVSNMPDLSKTLTKVTINKGSRLRWLAQKHYNEPELWVFIYEANKQKIKSPDHIRIGMELRIPKLSGEWLDINNPHTRQCVDSLLSSYGK